MNKYKLQYEIKSHNMTIEKFCENIGISRSAFYRKCDGKTEFTQGEIQKIINYLHIESPMEIFFDDVVS